MIEPGSWRRRTRWTRLTYGLLAVAALVLLVLDRPGASPGFFTALRSSSDDVAAPLMSAVSAPFHGLRTLRESLDQHWDVHRENDELRARLAEMEAWRQLALSLRGTVSAYEAILDVPAVETLDPVVAMTVAESGGPFQHARLMDAGEEHGVKAGYPVLTDRGLIGRVISVSRRSSRILLLTDASSRVPVMTEDGAVHGILIGDNTNLPRLDFGRGDRLLESGERIVTSGEADVYPRNLPVGLAAPAGDDLWRVRLYSGGGPADLAWIYPHEPIAPPPPEAVTPVFPAPPAPVPGPAVADGESDAAGAAAERNAADGAAGTVEAVTSQEVAPASADTETNQAEASLPGERSAEERSAE